MVFVTVYVPGVLAAKLTCPVAVLTNTRPVVDENVPATPPPINVGNGLEAFWQYGELAYKKVPAAGAVIVMLETLITAGHPPLAAMVFVTVYVPGVLATKLICPVDVLTNTRPAVDENVPAPPPPINEGDGFVALLQYGEPA